MKSSNYPTELIKIEIPNHKWAIDLLVLAVLVASIALVFGQVIHHEFLSWDDQTYVTRNTRVQGGLTWENLKWALTSFEATNWHPLTWLSLMLDVELFGVSPGKHLVVNAVMHGVASILLYGFLGRTTGRWLPSALVSLLFAIHPLRAESVAWVAERKDVLSAMLFMASLVLYAWYVKAPSLLRYGLVTASIVLGLISKPMLVTLPCVLILVDIWPLGRVPPPAGGLPDWVRYVRNHRGTLLLEKLPWFVLSLAAAVLTLLAQSHGKAVRTLVEVSFFDRLANALISYATYLGQILFPVNLTFIYPFRDSWQAEQLALSIGVLAAISWIVVRKGPGRPYLVLGWLWYLVMLLPVIGLITVGGQAMADRYTYLPSVGILVMLTWTVCDLLCRLQPAARVACLSATSLAVFASGYLAFQQVSHWRNGITLASHALKVNPDNFAAKSILAGELSNRGRFVEATEAAIEALRLGGHYLPVQGMSYLTLGDVAYRMSDTKRAIDYWNSALVAEAVRGEAYFRLARTALDLKDPTAAVEAVRSTLANDPTGEFRNLLVLSGRDLLKRGFVDEAIIILGEMRQAFPSDADVRLTLADALARNRRVPDAISELEDFLAFNPGHAVAEGTLAALRQSGG